MYGSCEGEGAAKNNRMQNRTLQSINTFLSAGDGVVKQMWRDFCSKSKKNLDKHKRKFYSIEVKFVRGGIERGAATIVHPPHCK